MHSASNVERIQRNASYSISSEIPPPPPDDDEFVGIDMPARPDAAPVAAAGLAAAPPQGDAPRRVSRCNSFCEKTRHIGQALGLGLGIGLVNGFIKVPASHGVGVAGALAGRAALTYGASLDNGAAAGLGAAGGLVGLTLGAAAGYKAGGYVAHRIGWGDYEHGFQIGGAMLGAAPTIGALMIGSNAFNPYQSMVLLGFQVLFREVGQTVRDCIGNGILKDVLPTLEVRGPDGELLSDADQYKFDLRRTGMATVPYAASSVAQFALLQHTLTSAFGFPQGLDFSEVVLAGFAGMDSSLANEVFDDIQGPIMMSALALMNGYSVRWKEGGGYSQLCRNMKWGSGISENAGKHAAMRVAGGAPADFAKLVANTYAPGTPERLTCDVITGGLQAMTEFRHNFVRYGTELRQRRGHAFAS